MRSVNKYDIITKEPKERIEMITKEDYQLIRSHPAFSEIPVEKFDMSGLRSLTLLTPSRIWITSKKELSSHTVVCLQIQLITIQPLP